MFPQPVTLISRTKAAPDALGNDTFAEISTVVSAIVGLVGGGEQTAARDTASATLTIYLPASTVVSHIDAVEIDGKRWEVTGVPTPYRHALTGWTPGVEVNLQRVTG